MTIFRVRRSSGSRSIMFSMESPSAVDLVFVPGSLPSVDSSYVLAEKLDSESKINEAIDKLIRDLEGIRQVAKDALKDADNANS